MSMKFYKYHGLGNDYLVYDLKENRVELNAEMIAMICDRNFGLGSDGILIGPFWRNKSPEVKIYNPDGSEAEKSGNGVRIFSKYLKDAGYIKEKHFLLQTLGGAVEVTYNNEDGSDVTVSMGKLDFSREAVGAVEVPEELSNVRLKFGEECYDCTCVSIGNPHCVIKMPEVTKELVCQIGKYSEKAEYFPRRINTQIVKVLDRNNIQIEIYERGAGYTLASGSSSCAAAASMYRRGMVASSVNVHMPGGVLKIEIQPDWYVYMTGEVAFVGEMKLLKEFELKLIQGKK